MENSKEISSVQKLENLQNMQVEKNKILIAELTSKILSMHKASIEDNINAPDDQNYDIRLAHNDGIIWLAEKLAEIILKY